MWIAVSGSGKTSAIFQVGREFYTIYIPCIPKDFVHANNETRTEREKSGTFVFLEQTIEQEKAKNFNRSSREKTDEAKRISAVFIVSHFLVFLTKFPNATPIEFLYFQLSKLAGQDCVKVIFDHLLNLTFQACEYLARSIRVKIAEIFNKMGKLPTILLAVDEIEGAAASGHDYLSRNDKQDEDCCRRFSKLSVISKARLLIQ